MKLKEILKTHGKIALLFWSGQKLLPGYPMLEAHLNNTSYANRPFGKSSEPVQHYMQMPFWLEKAGFKNLKSKTLTADIFGGNSDFRKDDVFNFLNMFWSGVEKEVPWYIWKKYIDLTTPTSPNYILNDPNYAAFITYTMFIGENN